jgi:hypothetical protein
MKKGSILDQICTALSAHSQMRAIRTVLHGVAFAVLIAASAQSQPFIQGGVGLFSCGRWTSDRRQHNTTAYGEQQWVLGYLSAVADASGSTLDPLRGVDFESVWAWIDSYCAAHPLEQIAGAALEFIKAHLGVHR